MKPHISAATLSKTYFMSLSSVTAYGQRVAPRGQPTLELQPAYVEVEDTANRFLVLPGRQLNWAFGLREALMIAGGDNDARVLGFYNSRVLQFSDDGHTFSGAYGPRLRKFVCDAGTHQQYTLDQLQLCVDRLRKDVHTRQAVATIWAPHADRLDGSKDYPCNVMLMFTVRNDKLNCTVTRRSSDLVLGVPYDHVCFTVVQDLVANSLGVRPGKMVEVSNSLHYYEELYPGVLKLLLNSPGEKYLDFPSGRTTLDLKQFDSWYSEFKGLELHWMQGHSSPGLHEDLRALYVADAWLGQCAALIWAACDLKLNNYFTMFATLEGHVKDPQFWLLADHSFTERLRSRNGESPAATHHRQKLVELLDSKAQRAAEWFLK